MAVKRTRSGGRVLAVLEAVAAHQPVGVSALARTLGMDKSAAQRALMTLADDGWIRAAPGPPAAWELTPRLLTMARPPSTAQDLRRRARRVMEELRAATGETVFLMVPDVGRLVIVEALESSHMLRMVPPVGMTAPLRESASGRCILAFSTAARQAELLGAAAEAALLERLAATRARGFEINDGDISPDSVSIAAPILDAHEEPLGTLTVTAPRSRLPADARPRVGELMVEAATRLSGAGRARGGAAPVSPARAAAPSRSRA